jgi:hypothetical protein
MDSMEKKVQEIIDILMVSKDEAVDADKGNKKAAKRLRANNAKVIPLIKELKAQSLGK